MKATQTFSILIWANKAKMTDNEAPIFARVTVDGKRAEISLKKKIAPAKWDAKAGCVKGNNEEARTINNYITQVKSELFKLYTQLMVVDEFVTAEKIKLHFTGSKEERKTLLKVFEYHNTQMEKMVGIDVVPATLVKFKTIKSKVESFIKFHYKKSDMFLEELSYQFITNFEFYLKTEENIQHNTSMKYIQNLKKIIHISVKNGWLMRDPFTDFRCSFKKVDRNVLTEEELEVLENKAFNIRRIEVVKDLFVFSCYTGLAYIDVMNLTTNNISVGIDGEKWIFTERHKTGEKVRVPLLPVALGILNKYKTDPEVLNQGGLLPKLSNQKLNAYLKEVADLCGINKNLTFHLARHTFATTVTLANGVPMETVSKLLGHSSIKTTQIYAKVIEKKVSEDMKFLKSKLQNMKVAKKRRIN